MLGQENDQNKADKLKALLKAQGYKNTYSSNNKIIDGPLVHGSGEAPSGYISPIMEPVNKE